MNSVFFLPQFVSAASNFCTMYVFMLAELNEVLDRLKHGASQTLMRNLETSDMSSDETGTSKRCSNILSQKTFRMKKVNGSSEIGGFFVTTPTGTANKRSHFFAGSAEKMIRSSHVGIMNCCGIFKGLPILRMINICTLKPQGGGVGFPR